MSFIKGNGIFINFDKIICVYLEHIISNWEVFCDIEDRKRVSLEVFKSKEEAEEYIKKLIAENLVEKKD